ncbi:hypothetical protein ACVBEF_04270 [Glaciimonas sp. GG7]
MSLRWIKYSAVIGTEIAIRLSGSKLAQAQKVDFPSAWGDAVERTAIIEAVINALPRSALTRLDTLEVAIGYPYANNMILPWQDDILVPADRLAYAESMLEQQYGIALSEWYCEISQERFGCPAIASAIRRDIVDEIVAASKQQKLRLKSVRALLTDTIASHPGALPADAVFVVRQSAGYEFAFRQDGMWRNAFALPGAGQTTEQCLMSASMMANHFPVNIYLNDIATDDDASTAQENEHAIV